MLAIPTSGTSPVDAVALCAADWRDSSAPTIAISPSRTTFIPPCLGGSEVELRRELHDPHVAVGRGDRTRVRRSECHHRVAEVHPVENVEDFDAKFDLPLGHAHVA